jgi:hypothetical protein
MDLSTATDNEILTELQRRPALLRDAVSYAEDDDIIQSVIKRGIPTNDIYDEDIDDREPDHGPEDQFLDSMMEDRMEFGGHFIDGE